MRRGFVAAAVAGAAGITLGLMPVSSAFASSLPQTYRCSDYRGSDWRGDDWWRNCCDTSRADRPSWCWDNDSDNNGWNSNWDNSNWSNDRWDHDNWNHDNWNDNGSWNHDNGNWNHDNGNNNWRDGGSNDGGYRNGNNWND